MDFADDVAYSVHDLEDGVVGGRIDLGLLDHAEERAATWQTVRDWYLPDASDELLEDALGRVRSVAAWPDSPYDGSRRTLAALKNLTSDLIGIFCGSVHRATQLEYGDRPLVRHQADLVVPAATAQEIAVLKGIAAHYVMRAQDRVGLLERQRTSAARAVRGDLEAGQRRARPRAAARLRRGCRRRGPHPRGDRPDRQPDRRVRGHPACRPGSRPPRQAREGGSMTAAETKPLVWLPFEPEKLGEVPDSLRYERVDPEDLPDSADEVELYVLPYRFRPADGEALTNLPKLKYVQTMSAGVEHIRKFVPEHVQLCNGRGIHDTSTAELTLTLILASLRGVPEFVRAQERSEWQPETA